MGFFVCLACCKVTGNCSIRLCDTINVSLKMQLILCIRFIWRPCIGWKYVSLHMNSKYSRSNARLESIWQTLFVHRVGCQTGAMECACWTQRLDVRFGYGSRWMYGTSITIKPWWRRSYRRFTCVCMCVCVGDTVSLCRLHADCQRNQFVCQLVIGLYWAHARCHRLFVRLFLIWLSLLLFAPLNRQRTHKYRKKERNGKRNEMRKKCVFFCYYLANCCKMNENGVRSDAMLNHIWNITLLPAKKNVYPVPLPTAYTSLYEMVERVAPCTVRMELFKMHSLAVLLFYSFFVSFFFAFTCGRQCASHMYR